jgi:transposase
MPAPWPRRVCSAPTALPIVSPIPSATCGAGCWSATPSSGRARATSPSSGPCSRQQGYRVPSGSAENFIQRVQRLPLPGRLLSVVAPLLALMRPLNQQLAYCDERIEHLAVQDPRVPRLHSVPGVGPVTAAAFRAAVDDAQRFRHAHQLEAYLGLVPREYSSGETRRRGPITKAGHSRTRWLLIQAAVSILRRHPPQAEALRTWTLRIAARRGKQVAVVALARRLAGILYALLRDGTCSSPSEFGLRIPRRPPS